MNHAELAVRMPIDLLRRSQKPSWKPNWESSTHSLLALLVLLEFLKDLVPRIRSSKVDESLHVTCWLRSEAIIVGAAPSSSTAHALGVASTTNLRVVPRRGTADSGHSMNFGALSSQFIPHSRGCTEPCECLLMRNNMMFD